MPGEEFVISRSGEGEKLLERGLVAAKETLGLEGLEIEPVKEWPVALGRRAGS